MVKTTQTKLDESSNDDFAGFTGLSEKTIHPFFKWDESEGFVAQLTDKIDNYEISAIAGCFGTSHFIDLSIYDFDTKSWSIQKLKIDSNRLRIALKKFSDKVKTFPSVIQVKRTGSKYQTQYEIKPYVIPK